jgi:CheY-like chemotaxis protein
VKGAEAGAAVGRLLHLEACALKQLGDKAANVVVVVDHENAVRGHTAFIPGRRRLFYPPRRRKGMARILIHEPHPDVRVLLAAVVRRAGHDPVGQGELTSDDAPELMILEPASADGLAAAARLRRRLEDLPIICASIEPPSLATKALGPVAYLLKPFRLGDLEAAIASALAA